MKIVLAKGNVHQNMKLFHMEMKVYKCTNFVPDCFQLEKMGKLGF